MLDELEKTLARPKLRRLLDDDEVNAFLELLRSGLAERVEDPGVSPGIQSRDPKDDYLIAAANSAHATLVTGDADLLELAGSIPVMSPRAFLKTLERSPGDPVSDNATARAARADGAVGV